MDWSDCKHNPQAYGLAAAALTVALIKILAAKGMLSQTEAREIVSSAQRELERSQASHVEAAKKIVETEILPDFPGR
ncbi:hypothetical protein [Methylobacterium sp. BE186]|uniref:hypothetical protein n=1 Tax=Methylobacterium sp. BE186 TaxID=2817715 RepID=UPI00286D2D38|nr:hypothetical protein [Methylobacterium sp. BE186]